MQIRLYASTFTVLPAHLTRLNANNQIFILHSKMYDIDIILCCVK